MKSSYKLISISCAMLLTLAVFNQSASAVPLKVWNHSFELPAHADNGATFQPTIAAQGGNGWTWVAAGPGSYDGVWNTDAASYSNAGGNNTPTGADGAQVAIGLRGASASISGCYQTLIGNDGIASNGDDPVLTANTLYTVTLAVGRRLTTSAAAYGDLKFRLFAGATQIGISPTFTPSPAGEFKDLSFSVDSSTLAPGLLGQALVLQIYQNAAGGLAEFDNARVDAVAIPEPSTVLLGLIAAAGVGAVIRKRRAG